MTLRCFGITSIRTGVVVMNSPMLGNRLAPKMSRMINAIMRSSGTPCPNMGSFNKEISSRRLRLQRLRGPSEYLFWAWSPFCLHAHAWMPYGSLLFESYTETMETVNMMSIPKIRRLNLGRRFLGPFGAIFLFVNVFDRSRRLVLAQGLNTPNSSRLSSKKSPARPVLIVKI
jgi:hypothetical protein